MINDGKSHEIIIIKRGNEEEEAHHGGAWKIAFADFMTAMMALFLVLWLINAANEETKRAVASYFNPVKLVDRNRSSKGINDQKGGPTSETGKGVAEPMPGVNAESPKTSTITATVQHNKDRQDNDSLEAAFFAEPIAAIDSIKNVGIKAATDLPNLGKTGGDTSGGDFADPFMPASSGKGEVLALSKTQISDSGKLSSDNSVADGDTEITASNALNSTATNKGQEDQKQKQLAAEEIKLAIRDALRSETENSRQLEASIEVTATGDGVLISVSDTVKDPMFEIGSAVPAPAMVLAVEAISKTLLARNGWIHISGHTDGRQFQDERDGNWRLSTQRAKATYFILMHGGLPDGRIQEISGRADRQLRNVADPLSGENRRIEILLGSP